MTSIIPKDYFNINEGVSCPDYQGAFDAQVVTGILYCVACDNRYFIKNSIYHLMPSFDAYKKNEQVFRD